MGRAGADRVGMCFAVCGDVWTADGLVSPSTPSRITKGCGLVGDVRGFGMIRERPLCGALTASSGYLWISTKDSTNKIHPIVYLGVARYCFNARISGT